MMDTAINIAISPLLHLLPVQQKTVSYNVELLVQPCCWDTTNIIFPSIDQHFTFICLTNQTPCVVSICFSLLCSRSISVCKPLPPLSAGTSTIHLVVSLCIHLVTVISNFLFILYPSQQQKTTLLSPFT